MRTFKSTLAIAVLLATAPVASLASSAVDCGNDQGRDHLTVGTTTFDLEAPGVAAPELANTYAETGPLVTRHRSATFHFLANLAPHADALLKARIDWSEQSDYDLFLHDAYGERARSAESNIDGGQTTFEELEAPIFHCESLTVFVRNWAGLPNQPMTLTLEVTGGSTMLACAADDSAPGCVGKTAGEAPEPVADDRARLYLGGEPGQVSMVGPFQQAESGEQSPFASELTTDRPLGGTPNQHTRGLVGFRDPSAGAAHENPFLAHFKIQTDDVLLLDGDDGVVAAVWVSAPIGDASTTVYADLYGDGVLGGSVALSGITTLRDPTLLVFEFEELDLAVFESLTLQVATQPVATSGGVAGNPMDATLTVWYGSAQFQSVLVLPPAAA